MNTLLSEKKIVLHPAVFELMDHGIVRVTPVEGVEEFEVTIPFIEEEMKVIIRLTGDRPCRLLFCLGNVFLRMDHEVREYIVGSKTVNRLKVAEAIVTTSLATRILTNFYLVFHRPPRPARMFSSEERALNWLMRFPVEW